MTLNQFEILENEALNIIKTSPELRLGQIIYGLIVDQYPYVAIKLANSDLDMFYLDVNIKKYKESIMVKDIEGIELRAGDKVYGQARKGISISML